MSALKPRKPVPDLKVETVAGSPWNLRDRKPGTFSMIVVYRGLHCPICATYLRELEGKLDEFQRKGVDVIAMSTDDEVRAREAKDKWNLPRLAIGYGLSIDKAREWGLYVSTSRGKTSAAIEEPPLFAEPGLFLVKSDGTLYACSISTMPFARPHFDEILNGLEYVIANNYPARGEA